jgi:SAM-dependent methyltransferase
MSNPWLSIPLTDYEGHMCSAGLQQLPALSELFKRALNYCLPDSVAVLGIAGGNGLEHIDCARTNRILGFDINAQYLDEVRRRFGALPGLELYCLDLAEHSVSMAPVRLVHAALVFEHTGLDRALENALSLVAPGGKLSVVLQLPSLNQPNVTLTCYASMQRLKQSSAMIDVGHFRGLLEHKGFRLVEEEGRSLPAGKALWLGIFAQH